MIFRHPTFFLLLATLLLLGQSLPAFSPAWIPAGDTFYRYQVFHWFYSDFLFHHELPLWMPYGTYGMSAYFHQLSALSPATFLVMVTGKLFQVSDTLFLYSITALMESFSFLLGVHLLAGLLFQRTSAHLFVLFGSLFSLTWLGQPYFNLQAFQGLPWLLYFLIRWRQEGRWSLLWLAGIAEIITMAGSFIYAVILHFWLVVVFLLPSFLSNRQLPRWQKRQDGGWLLLMLLLALLFSWFTLAGLEGVVNLSPGRDSTGQQVSWQEFFSFGRLQPNLLLFNQLTGAYPHWESDNYAGLAPLLLLPYALYQVRSPWLWGFSAMFFLLAGLSLGYVTPYLAYHLPGMDHFRHISHLLPTAKLCLIFIGGFAIQALEERQTIAPSPYWRAGVTTLLVLFLLDGWLGWHHLSPPPLQLQEGPWLHFLSFRLVIYLSLFLLLFWWRAWPPRQAWILVGIFLLDVASYQLYASQRLPLANPPYERTLFQATPLPYLAQRTPHSGVRIPSPFGRHPQLLHFLTRRGDLAHHFPLIYTFGHLDPCYPQSRLLLFPQPILALLQSRGGQPTIHQSQFYPQGSVIQQGWNGQSWQSYRYLPNKRTEEITMGGYHMLPANDSSFWSALGCGSDKLRLMEQVTFVRDEEQAKQHLATLADPQNHLLVMADPLPAHEKSPPVGSIQVSDFSSNRLTSQVTLQGSIPRWLNYADSWHPHWQVKVDDESVPVYRSQVGFKAILLSPGTHEVVWQFTGGLAGWCARLLAWISLLAYLVGTLYVFQKSGKPA
ncbi:MAG: YfhO family protein [Magnetococcales bacterium]|nr:hypothetical protein [Magnetococcales bacterium]NGZ26745.1 YfhO family protein [Magnetococcales bacterium]